MSRIQTQLKIHELKGPRLPYKPEEAEIRENEYSYLDADGIAIPDGEGILYWVDTIVTTDAGGARVYDEQSATGNTLCGAYGAKAVDGVLKSWDPPKRYLHGVFVNLTTAVVEVCYRPLARNLRCRISPVPFSAKNLVCRLTAVAVFWNYSKNLVAKVLVRGQDSKDLITRVTVRPMVATTALVSKVTVRGVSAKNLVCRLYADQTP